MSEGERHMQGRNRAQGGSLVEVLIASLLFFMVVVGVLPLFIRSIRNNHMGNESTAVSNYGRSGVEDLHGLLFDDPRLVINAGNESVLPQEYFHPGFSGGVRAVELDRWDNVQTGSVWRRQATVRQFSGKAPEARLSAGADPNTTGLRGIEVLVDNPRTDGAASLAFGRSRRIRYVIFKAF